MQTENTQGRTRVRKRKNPAPDGATQTKNSTAAEKKDKKMAKVTEAEIAKAASTVKDLKAKSSMPGMQIQYHYREGGLDGLVSAAKKWAKENPTDKRPKAVLPHSRLEEIAKWSSAATAKVFEDLAHAVAPVVATGGARGRKKPEPGDEKSYKVGKGNKLSALDATCIGAKEGGTVKVRFEADKIVVTLK